MSLLSETGTLLMNDRPPLSTLQDNRLFEAETEIRQLKDAVNAMRAELERNQRDRCHEESDDGCEGSQSPHA